MLPKADRNIHTQIAKYEESLYRKKVVMETHSHFEKIENEMRQNLKRTIETLNEDYAKKRKTYEEDFKNQIQKTNDEFETIISGIRKKREEAIIETKKQEGFNPHILQMKRIHLLLLQPKPTLTNYHGERRR